MINKWKYAIKYVCKDDPSLIENYDKAINDDTQVWVLHHRLELTLDGEYAHSKEELKRLDMYYNRPYYELIFLPDKIHRKMHIKTRPISTETRNKISKSMTGVNNSMHGKTPWNKGLKGSDYTSHFKNGIGRNSKINKM